MTTVLALGTCRIFRPLYRLEAAGSVDLLHYGKTGRWWFTHTTAVDIVREALVGLDLS